MPRGKKAEKVVVKRPRNWGITPGFTNTKTEMGMAMVKTYTAHYGDEVSPVYVDRESAKTWIAERRPAPQAHDRTTWKRATFGAKVDQLMVQYGTFQGENPKEEKALENLWKAASDLVSLLPAIRRAPRTRKSA